MPDLKQCLLEYDFGNLRIIAENWGINILSGNVRSARDDLVDKILDVDLVRDVFVALPEEAVLAIFMLIENQGRIPWPQFTRRFGQVREMGPGRRDRERPDQNPASITEILWYRAFVGRAFFDSTLGAEEFAYIPTDIQTLITNINIGRSPLSQNALAEVLGRTATTAEKAVSVLATDRILDHACTLLAGLRIGEDMPDLGQYSRDFIMAILFQAGIISKSNTPDLEKTRLFLEASRADALATLVQAWLNTTEHNDLQHVPGLQIEGEWKNDPLGTRRFLLPLLSAIPKDTWWSLSAFIADIRQQHPDFQRPAGDYDSWYIKDMQTGEYLRGFEHWNDVDGALISYIISGPLHWLGIIDISRPADELQITAFKLSKWGINLLKGVPVEGLPEENQPVYVRSDGRVGAPFLVPRAVRYQLARFCTWEIGNIHEYRYRLTPSSLTRAREVGLRVSHLNSLLRRHAESIPPNILSALDRWEKSGTQVRMHAATILRVGSPQILTSLRNSHAARYLGDPLSHTTITIKEGAEEKVLAALVEMGYFGEFSDGGKS